MANLDPNYALLFPMQEQIIDKTTGLPLAAGVVKFFSENNRSVPKNVYALTGTYNNYNYVNVGSVLTLSSIGTFLDGSGNNFIPYLYLLDAQNKSELYYIEVYDVNGGLQFTVAAWPNSATNTNPVSIFADTENELSNPQFVVVNFPNQNPYTFSTSNATDTFPVAPGWDLIVTGTGTYGFTVKQTSITTTELTNPPYCLEFTSWSGSTTSAVLRQRLQSSSRLLSNGFISGVFAVSSKDGAAHNFSMNYVPSNALIAPTSIASGTSGTSTVFSLIKGTAQITNINTGTSAPTGYIDIDINLPVGSLFQITSLQICGVENGSSSTEFIELTADRQMDYLSHYYMPQVQYKPIPSYLVGWDFPLNPAQFLGTTVAASAIGANKSKYVWDQTIIFQSANSGVGVTRGTASELLLTAAATTQMAIVQYLDQTQARKILNAPICSNISAKASVATTATVSLWYTTDVSLPSAIGSNNSIVATLDANGYPATFNGNWTAVPRALGKAQFTIGTSSTTNFNDYSFNGWDMQGIAASNTATYFAIVIGTASVTITGTIGFNSISLQAGSNATRPAPQSFDSVLNDCQFYYQKSFEPGVIPAQGIGAGGAESYGNQTVAAASTNNGPWIRFPVPMVTEPVTITLFNPAAANAQIRNLSKSSDYTATAITNVSKWGFTVNGTSPGGSAIGDLIGVNWTCDARLGQ